MAKNATLLVNLFFFLMSQLTVNSLFIKSQAGQPVSQCQTIILQKGQGIIGDAHAVLGSPRQILLVSAKTLLDFHLKPGDLAENILINGEIEQFSSGQVLQIGETLIRLTFLCEPCKYLEKVQVGLSKRIKNRRGLLGIVVQGGEINLGDRILLTAYRFPSLPDDAKGRFREFVARIPLGKVVRTSDLLVALGVTQAYYRAIGSYIKQALASLPVHRLVRADRTLLTKYIPEQAEFLRAEGVQILRNQVNLDYLWDSSQFHSFNIEKVECLIDRSLTCKVVD